MNTNAVHVLLAGDEGVVPGLLVTVSSLLHNCEKGRTVVVHFMDTGLQPKSLAALRSVVALFPDARLDINRVDVSPFRGANMYRGSYGAYARLLVQRYVSAHRVVYVDTDFLFLRNVAELYDMDMRGNIVLATPTPMIPTLADDCPFLPRAQTEGWPYMNSGIMLVDLDKWRESDVEARILDILREPIVLAHHDQTLLNFVLRGVWEVLDSSWGLLQVHDTEKPLSTNFHFGGGGVKPWKKGCHYSAAPLWWAYYDGIVKDRYRFTGDWFLKSYSLILLVAAHLVGALEPVSRMIFDDDKVARMRKRDYHYGIMRTAAVSIKKGLLEL